MIRNLLLTTAAALVFAVPVEAKRVLRVYTTLEKTARAEVIVTGKVSAIEKETVDAVRYPGDTQKVIHKVAVIKIDKGLVGTGGVTHVKVAFVPPPPADPNAPPVRRGPLSPVDLKEGQEGLFFLTRHPGADFYTITPLMTPLDPKADDYKANVEQVVKAATALADPAKALKAAKAEDRYFAAIALVARYRAYPEFGGETSTEKVPAEESKLILQALTEGDWKKAEPDGVNGAQAFYQLGLNDKDGWKPPQPRPNVDYADDIKAAFAKWLDGPGKDYRIGRIVPKKPGK